GPVTAGLMQVSGSSGPHWQPLRIGAGGYLRDIDIASDGTTVCKTDTYGAYYWNPSLRSPGNAGGNGTWVQLCQPSAFAGGDPAFNLNTVSGWVSVLGVYAIRIAPNTQIFYMVWLGRLYKTINRGVSWTNCTNFPTQTITNANPNDNSLGGSEFGPKMAIDPNNPSAVWIGCGQDLIFTHDGGTSFTTVSTGQIPQPTNAAGGYAIAFDPTSPVSAGVSQRFIVASYGNGVYLTTNGGTTFTVLSGGSFSGTMPTTFRRMVFDQFGALWLSDNSGLNQNLWAFTTHSGLAITQNAWTNLSATINEPIHAIAPDPASASSSAQRIVLLDEGGSVNQTLTGGSTWLGEQGFPFSGKISLVANDIPWLAKNEPFFQTGNAMFDPSQSNRLCIGEGIGFWVANPPSDITTSWSWTSQSAGIEQLVSNHIISPPGGNPCVFSWDRDVFEITSPKVYPTDYGSLPYNPNSSTTQIAAGWGGDYASSSPSF